MVYNNIEAAIRTDKNYYFIKCPTSQYVLPCAAYQLGVEY